MLGGDQNVWVDWNKSLWIGACGSTSFNRGGSLLVTVNGERVSNGEWTERVSNYEWRERVEINN